MSTTPPNLPDERTAQRLLDLLSQVEHTLKNARPSPQVTSLHEGQLSKLQAENTALRHRQQQASQKIENLITQLESAPEPVQEGAAA